MAAKKTKAQRRAEFELYARMYLRNPDWCVNIQTDTNFYAGMDDGLPKHPKLREIYLRNARKVGVDPNGKRYEPELAAKGCGLDPEAWVPRTEGRSYIRNLLKKRGWTGMGRVEVQGIQHEPPSEIKPKVADDIVEGVVRRKIREEKLVLSSRERAELKEKVRKNLLGGK